MSDTFWSGLSVWISGASSGMGRALAQYVSGRGSRVGLIARREARLEQLAIDLHGRGSACAWAAADICDLAAVRNAAERFEQELGPCDVVVAGAGVYRKTEGRKFSPEKAADVLTTNLIGVTNLLGAVMPGMVTRGRGHVAAISSLAGLLGLPAAGAYAASKAGLLVLMESLRVELTGHGIHVTTLVPGYVDTEMITDEERRQLRGLWSAERAARRMARAIERKETEAWFPRSTAWAARGVRALPWFLRQRVLSRLPEMEEAAPPPPY